ncbi:MAG: twin-arginine translocase TatA/TatE family subunit [Myxococcales bacterium]|nr:twin-arginine translocase TatA/TatE family subunit [Myxococcales bacterium]
MGVGPWQLAVIVLFLLLLFGAGRLGGIGRGLGEAVRAFKNSMNDAGRRRARGKADDADDDDDDPGERQLPKRKKRVAQAPDTVLNKRHVRARRRAEPDDNDDNDDERN